MEILAGQLENPGHVLSEADQKKVRESLVALKSNLKTSTCRRCGEPIRFAKGEDLKIIPHNLDGSAHWQTCPYSGFAQRKASLGIMKKLAVLQILKYGLNLEGEAGLTKTEVQIVHATLERIFKDDNHAKTVVEDKMPDVGKVDDDVQFKPEPCDPIGDPDEERAPLEGLVHVIEEKINSEHDLDKGVEKVISEPIADQEALVAPLGAPAVKVK